MKKFFKVSRPKKVILWLLILLIGWIVADIFYPLKRNISKIDAEETPRMDAAMWRSYYEKKPIKLFFQSAKLMRIEFHFPLWRSHRVAYYAAKAAFLFKDGHTRDDYEKALPYLKRYYVLFNDIATATFNTDRINGISLQAWRSFANTVMQEQEI